MEVNPLSGSINGLGGSKNATIHHISFLNDTVRTVAEKVGSPKEAFFCGVLPRSEYAKSDHLVCTWSGSFGCMAEVIVVKKEFLLAKVASPERHQTHDNTLVRSERHKKICGATSSPNSQF